jgi:hypothetical protein
VTLYFLDTSALIKRYVSEIGSVWVQSVIAPSSGNIITISELAKVDVAATLARRRRDGSLTPAAVHTHLALQEPLVFICADNNLLAVAATEGLTTDNPLAHP